VGERRDTLRTAAANFPRHAHQVADHGDAGGVSAPTRSRSIFAEHALTHTALYGPCTPARMVEVGISAGRTNRISRPVSCVRRRSGGWCASGARILEIERRDAPDALHEDVRRRDLLAEGQRGQEHQLAARVVAIHVGAGVGFGIAQALREAIMVSISRRSFDLGEDVVTCPVENAVQGCTRSPEMPSRSTA